MDSKKYIGMEVHKESISIAVRNGAGEIVMECVTGNWELRQKRRNLFWWVAVLDLVHDFA